MEETNLGLTIEKTIKRDYSAIPAMRNYLESPDVILFSVVHKSKTGILEWNNRGGLESAPFLGLFSTKEKALAFMNRYAYSIRKMIYPDDWDIKKEKYTSRLLEAAMNHDDIAKTLGIIVVYENKCDFVVEPVSLDRLRKECPTTSAYITIDNYETFDLEYVEYSLTTKEIRLDNGNYINHGLLKFPLSSPIGDNSFCIGDYIDFCPCGNSGEAVSNYTGKIEEIKDGFIFINGAHWYDYASDTSESVRYGIPSNCCMASSPESIERYELIQRLKEEEF